MCPGLPLCLLHRIMHMVLPALWCLLSTWETAVPVVLNLETGSDSAVSLTGCCGLQLARHEDLQLSHHAARPLPPAGCARVAWRLQRVVCPAWLEPADWLAAADVGLRGASPHQNLLRFLPKPCITSPLICPVHRNTAAVIALGQKDTCLQQSTDFTVHLEGTQQI